MPRVAATAVRPLPAQAAMAPCSLRHPALARQLAAGVRRRYTVSDIATPFHQTALPGLQQESSKPWARPAVMPAPAAPSALHRVWSAYLQSLATRPLLTKAATSFVCVVIGDTIAQAIGGTPYSILRVLRLAAYSSTVGATTGHYWHRWLEAQIHPESPRSLTAVAKKTLLDQLLLAPVMTALFFAALKLMEGRPDAIAAFLAERGLPTVATSVAVWIPYNLAAFKLVPEQLRPLSGGILGAYMSVSCINTPACSAATAAAVAAALDAQQ